MNRLELYMTLRETVLTELQLGVSYLDRVAPSDVAEDARLAFQHVLALARPGYAWNPPAAAIPSLIQELIHESRNALVPVYVKLKPLQGFDLMKVRICILKVLDECTEVGNELECG